MTQVFWDLKARDFLRKLPKDIARRIFQKMNKQVKNNVCRFIEGLTDIDAYKIRIGDYRLFVDYYQDKDILFVRTIKHRRNAYKNF